MGIEFASVSAVPLRPRSRQSSGHSAVELLLCLAGVSSLAAVVLPVLTEGSRDAAARIWCPVADLLALDAECGDVGSHEESRARNNRDLPPFPTDQEQAAWGGGPPTLGDVLGNMYLRGELDRDRGQKRPTTPVQVAHSDRAVTTDTARGWPEEASPPASERNVEAEGASYLDRLVSHALARLRATDPAAAARTERILETTAALSPFTAENAQLSPDEYFRTKAPEAIRLLGELGFHAEVVTGHDGKRRLRIVARDNLSCGETDRHRSSCAFVNLLREPIESIEQPSFSVDPFLPGEGYYGPLENEVRMHPEVFRDAMLGNKRALSTIEHERLHAKNNNFDHSHTRTASDLDATYPYYGRIANPLVPEGFDDVPYFAAGEGMGIDEIDGWKLSVDGQIAELKRSLELIRENGALDPRAVFEVARDVNMATEAEVIPVAVGFNLNYALLQLVSESTLDSESSTGTRFNYSHETGGKTLISVHRDLVEITVSVPVDGKTDYRETPFVVLPLPRHQCGRDAACDIRGFRDATDCGAHLLASHALRCRFRRVSRRCQNDPRPSEAALPPFTEARFRELARRADLPRLEATTGFHAVHTPPERIPWTRNVHMHILAL